MPRRKIHVTGAPEAPLRAALAALRSGLGIPEAFPPEVQAAAEQAAKDPALPLYDATDIPFFTLDPPTSTDLDQATHLSRRGTGYRVRYAIADVAAFVAPGGALDAEAHRRVTTLYFPDERVPLHPTVLSEGAASLLPGRTRPAVLWTIDLDGEGRTLAVDVRRALVRSRAKLDYTHVQRDIDAGTAEEPVALLKEIGEARERLEGGGGPAQGPGRGRLRRLCRGRGRAPADRGHRPGAVPGGHRTRRGHGPAARRTPARPAHPRRPGHIEDPLRRGVSACTSAAWNGGFRRCTR